jgi:hypothetical protein
VDRVGRPQLGPSERPKLANVRRRLSADQLVGLLSAHALGGDVQPDTGEHEQPGPGWPNRPAVASNVSAAARGTPAASSGRRRLWAPVLGLGPGSSSNRSTVGREPTGPESGPSRQWPARRFAGDVAGSWEPSAWRVSSRRATSVNRPRRRPRGSAASEKPSRRLLARGGHLRPADLGRGCERRISQPSRGSDRRADVAQLGARLGRWRHGARHLAERPGLPPQPLQCRPYLGGLDAALPASAPLST